MPGKLTIALEGEAQTATLLGQRLSYPDIRSRTNTQACTACCGFWQLPELLKSTRRRIRCSCTSLREDNSDKL